jgi:hypothetical protein
MTNSKPEAEFDLESAPLLVKIENETAPHNHSRASKKKKILVVAFTAAAVVGAVGVAYDTVFKTKTAVPPSLDLKDTMTAPLDPDGKWGWIDSVISSAKGALSSGVQAVGGAVASGAKKLGIGSTWYSSDGDQLQVDSMKSALEGAKLSLLPYAVEGKGDGGHKNFDLVKNEYCYKTLPTAYKSLETAIKACSKNTAECGGVYDQKCDGKGQFKLCKAGADTPYSSQESCVYETPQQEAYGATGKKLTNLKEFAGPTAGGHGIVANLGDEVLIGFSGTDFGTVPDVVADATSILTTVVNLGGDTYTAGTGFVAQYLELLRVGLRAELEARVSKGTFVRVVGHSLGGALANLCAVECANMGAKVYMQTLGTPRVFQYPGTVNKIQNKLIQPWTINDPKPSAETIAPGKIVTERIVNWGDPVPLVPKTSKGHVGNGGVYVNQPYGSNKMFMTLHPRDFVPVQGGDVTHGTAEYISRITKAIEDSTK